MKVRIIEWSGVSTWHWNLGENESAEEYGGSVDDLCGICRVAFEGTCPNCKFPGDQCPIVLGAGCTHNFHLHCILKWLQQDNSRGLCPMCRQSFIPQVGPHFSQSEEFADLQRLIENHKLMAEGTHNSDDEFQSFRSEGAELPT